MQEANVPERVLNIKLDKMEQLEEAGLLRVITLRDNGLYGYAVIVLSPSLFFDSVEANVIAIYVHPKKRVGRIVLTLFKKIHEVSGKLGADRVNISSPNSSSLGSRLKRLGYSELESVYTRGV
jgi:hypothetical protein